MSKPRTAVAAACPVCGSRDVEPRFSTTGSGTEGGVSAEAFRPSSDRYGSAVGRVLRCRTCSHGFVEDLPAASAIASAYEDAADPVSVREEEGQVETARRALIEIEKYVKPGRIADVGCWTGSFLIAARERGWDPTGVEPSRWAVSRAHERGLSDVRQGDLDSHSWEPGTLRLVAMCDVLEHLEDPAKAAATVATLLEPGGAFYITVPDAGSRLARMMGRRWWSVLPMHLHHFTRASMGGMLERAGFRVRSMDTHPKVFTARYYAERLGGYTPLLEKIAVGAVKTIRSADKLVAPDFRDRLAVIATIGPER